MSRNVQPGTHPDADQLSVFVEGAASEHEQQRMLTHLAECAECRKAVFLMQPHEETQRTAATPEKGWVWRWLVPVGLPAAIACGLIAVFVYVRPHGEASPQPQQIASARQPETERARPEETVTSRAESEDKVAQSESAKNSVVPNIAAKDISRQKNRVEDRSNLTISHARAPNLPAFNSLAANQSAARSDQMPNGRATARGAAPQRMDAGPSGSGASGAVGTVAGGGVTVSQLPMEGRNVTNPTQSAPSADAKGVPSHGNLVIKKLPSLQIASASQQSTTLAGVSGRITDRSGANIAGATISLRDAAGTTRQTTTGADGSFQLTGLPAGQYELTATASGFRASQQPIELKASEMAMLTPMLDVGKASEMVEVGAEDAALAVQTTSANVSNQVTERLPVTSRVVPLPSGMPVMASVLHGKRVLSLDDAGNLFLSRNEGKKWKKIKPQWTGKVVQVELIPAGNKEAMENGKSELSTQANQTNANQPQSSPAKANRIPANPAPANEIDVFRLTTDAGIVWMSKDGTHWHQQ